MGISIFFQTFPKCFFVKSFLVVVFNNPDHHLAEIVEDDLTTAVIEFVLDVLQLLLGGIGSSTSHGTEEIIW